MKLLLYIVCLSKILLFTEVVYGRPVEKQSRNNQNQGICKHSPPVAIAPLTGEQPAMDSLTLSVNITQGQDKSSLYMSFKNLLPGRVSIELSSEDGTMFFYKTSVSEPVFKRTFQLYNLPVGDYKIEVKNKKEIYSKRVVISQTKGKRSYQVE